MNLRDGTGGGGDAAGDRISGFEIAIGSSSKDGLIGASVDETLLGGDGDDTVEGGAGADNLDGGGHMGGDLLSYLSSPSGVTVYLESSVVGGGDAVGDVIANFEHAMGGQGDDTLAALAAGSMLLGAAGDDSLLGDAGDDTLLGGTGEDELSGRGGRRPAGWRR